jgi:Domain of unknown function (DUF4403)
MTVRNSLTFIVCISLFIQCNVLKPSMPVESYQYAPLQPKPSIVNLFADLEVKKIEQLIDQHLDSILYQDTSFTDHNNDNLKIKASKGGLVKLDFVNDQLSWELPAIINFQKGVKVFGFNLPLVESWQYSGQLTLRYKTKLTVNRDWTLQTSTASDGFIWTKKPMVKIGNLDIPITFIANLILPGYLETFSKQIDRLIVNNFDFKGFVQKGWDFLSNPFKLPGDFQAWLSISPNSVSLLPIGGKSGFIRLGAAITSEVICSIDREPSPARLTSLPALEPLKLASDTFKVNLLTDIPYGTINSRIKEEIGDSIFLFGNRRIRFETFRVYGTNGKLAVETTVSGSINGTLYLTGIPYFNQQDTTLRIKELNFDIKTRNLATRSSKWLFNGKIERAITAAIAIPFNTDISAVEQQISLLISHYPLKYGFELNGRLIQLSVSDLYLTPESVKVNVVFSGNLSLGLTTKNN